MRRLLLALGILVGASHPVAAQPTSTVSGWLSVMFETSLPPPSNLVVSQSVLQVDTLQAPAAPTSALGDMRTSGGSEGSEIVPGAVDSPPSTYCLGNLCGKTLSSLAKLVRGHVSSVYLAGAGPVSADEVLAAIASVLQTETNRGASPMTAANLIGRLRDRVMSERRRLARQHRSLYPDDSLIVDLVGGWYQADLNSDAEALYYTAELRECVDGVIESSADGAYLRAYAKANENATQAAHDLRGKNVTTNRKQLMKRVRKLIKQIQRKC